MGHKGFGTKFDGLMRPSFISTKEMERRRKTEFACDPKLACLPLEQAYSSSFMIELMMVAAE